MTTWSVPYKPVIVPAEVVNRIFFFSSRIAFNRERTSWEEYGYQLPSGQSIGSATNTVNHKCRISIGSVCISIHRANIPHSEFGFAGPSAPPCSITINGKTAHGAGCFGSDHSFHQQSIFCQYISNPLGGKTALTSRPIRLDSASSIKSIQNSWKVAVTWCHLPVASKYFRDCEGSDFQANPAAPSQKAKRMASRGNVVLAKLLQSLNCMCFRSQRNLIRS